MTATSLSPLHILDAQSLELAGVEPITSHHWEGHLTTAVLMQGCPWQCAACSYPELQPATASGLEWEDVIAGLRDRAGLVDAVVFTGGEPTRQPGLADAMAQCRELGYQVALRTAGAYPRRLAEVLPLVDWVGIDMKAAPTAYERVTGQGVAGARAWSSLELVMRSGVPYEVTITVDPRAHSREDVLGAAREVIRRGAHAPVLCGRRLYEVITHDDLPDLARR